ncbi:AmmeMemoRadiSam system radical SAM enzyme [Candidatus Parcubacteria bacterium]|nr:AmmeMemoRadiSam system radical SAM enzyme [Candidatus Parcubacteria bacterium]
MKKAQFYTTDGKTVKCHLCHHQCRIEKGKAGICTVRVNDQGKLYSLVYGRGVYSDIDPIEKKPLFHFLPGTITYSIGTYGCNFFCPNCLNFSASQPKQINKLLESSDEISPEKIVENAIGDSCPSISYTYNEPTTNTEFILDTMKIAYANKIKNVWVSNGYMSDKCLDAILPYLDAINVDLKSFDDDFYRSHCKAKLAPILRNLKRLKDEQVHLEITTLIIPSLSSGVEMLEKLVDFIASELDTDTPWHISRFSPSISWRLKDLPETGEDMIYEAYEIAKSAGLKYVYVGNVPGDQKENTYCPKCSELAIRRFGRHVERLDKKGYCAYCDKSLDIIE